MRRTKEWWRMLERAERAELVRLERNNSTGYCRHSVLPDVGPGFCDECQARLWELIDKADLGMMPAGWDD